MKECVYNLIVSTYDVCKCCVKLCSHLLLNVCAIFYEMESSQFFIGVSHNPKYDIIWTENGDVINSFIPEILTPKESSMKHVQH